MPQPPRRAGTWSSQPGGLPVSRWWGQWGEEVWLDPELHLSFCCFLIGVKSTKHKMSYFIVNNSLAFSTVTTTSLWFQNVPLPGKRTGFPSSGCCPVPWPQKPPSAPSLWLLLPRWLVLFGQHRISQVCVWCGPRGFVHPWAAGSGSPSAAVSAPVRVSA